MSIHLHLLLLIFLSLTAELIADDRIPYAPSPEALERIGAQFLDALIKKGQMEMAKNAFKTQLDVLEKVHPEQYEQYRKLKIEDLAADAVMQQAEMAKLQPKTGNAFIDMLNGNGIPIGSSIRGLEDAIRTQKDLETNDPSEQIAKAVLDKFQTQILPGLVANMIAGRNPFKIPKPTGEGIARFAMAEMNGNEVRRSEPRQQVDDEETEEDDSDRRSLEQRIRASPRLRSLLKNQEIASLLNYNRRMRDEPLNDDASVFRAMKQKAQLDQKSQIVLGIHGFDEEEEDDEEQVEKNIIANFHRTSSMRMSPRLRAALESNRDVKSALDRIAPKIEDVEKYLEPKPWIENPNKQPGFYVPRKIPMKPRKMLPLLIAADEKEVNEERRRHPSGESTPRTSRVIENLKNNPSLAALFLDDHLESILSGRQMLSDDQKGRRGSIKTIKALPRLFSANSASHLKPIDTRVVQMIEERPVPPLFWQPKGRHTRLRWTGANEREIPGIGARFIIPSLDPTTPAINSAVSTQGRARDEWDAMFKVPNQWNPGDEIGFNMTTNTKRLVAGNGGVDMPALEP